MSALKRLHGMQQASRAGRAGRQDESPSKRLKSSHNNNAFASILASNDASRKKLTAATTNGVPNKAANKVDDTRATVATNANGVNAGSDAISITSDESNSETDGSDEDESDVPMTNGVHETNGKNQETIPADDVQMTNGAEAESEEDTEPSFGDMLKARHPDVIDINAQLPDPHAEPPHLEPASGKGALLRPVTGHSLTTVLQQALKTNDKDMLESCFHLRDVQAIRNTIQRLPSPLVGNLLSRISERIYKRPGRTGSLMIWIQWSLVAHGGYLATQPDILRKLKALNQVVRQRAQGLQPLVQLKAKLDMLNAQLELRRGVQSQRLRTDAADEEDGVLYIEGQDDSGSQSDDDGVLAIEAAPVPDGDLDEEVDELNAIQQDESADDEGEAGDDVLDIEAEETDNDDDSEDNDSEDSDEASASEGDEDLDDDDSSEESEEEVKAPKPQTLNRKR